MHEKLFRIGELARIFHLSVKTLRFYSDKGLLQPAYIDEYTGYRYYSMEQFVRIDLIRNSRKMGMSLAEIQSMLSQTMDAEHIQQLINRQMELMDQKIQEYQNIRHSMAAIRGAILAAQQHPLNQVYLSQEPERYFKAYPYLSTTPEEQELNFRRAALSSGEKAQEVYAIFGVSTRYAVYQQEGRLENPDIRQFLPLAAEADCQIQPAGLYACLNFDDNVCQKSKYYAILMDYLQAGGGEPCGDFIEEWIIPRLENGRESTLIKLSINLKSCP